MKSKILLIVVILTLLAGVVLIAFNPQENNNDADDVLRRANVNSILNAVWKYSIENNGTFPDSITSTSQAISNSAADICADIVPAYIARLPVDPTTGTYTDCTNYDTGYMIYTDSTGQHIVITATLNDDSSFTQTR